VQYTSVSDLLADARGCLKLANGGVKVNDAQRFREQLLDKLVHSAVFGDQDVKAAARWLIWEAAWELGVKSASIDSLYQARSRDEYQGVTVPAINVRGMAYDTARAVVRAVHARKVGPFIFELARSEMGYTDQTCDEFATVVTAASLREGYEGPIFIQGDHYQANAKRYQADPEKEIEGLRKLVREAVAAGYGNIDIDTSTLVDLIFPTLDEQQRHNYERCAEVAALIRQLEPEGVTISIGGEIGEVGKKNSTVEELDAYMDGFNRVFAERVGGGVRGLSKISVNTGSTHGGVVLPDGTIAKVKIDFDTLRAMSDEARKYGLGGAVQHGASTLPAEAFHRFPETGTLEVHLATEFQNIAMDHPSFPPELREEIRRFAFRELADERGADDTDEQFVYKSRKKAWGPFKQQVWEMDSSARGQISRTLEEKFEFLYDQLGVTNTRHLVEQHIQPAKIAKPQPDALKAVAAGS
jgi:fructose/tagatose bisphosphate aldolase